jgi:hypothetical protein
LVRGYIVGGDHRCRGLDGGRQVGRLSRKNAKKVRSDLRIRRTTPFAELRHLSYIKAWQLLQALGRGLSLDVSQLHYGSPLDRSHHEMEEVTCAYRKRALRAHEGEHLRIHAPSRAGALQPVLPRNPCRRIFQINLPSYNPAPASSSLC